MRTIQVEDVPQWLVDLDNGHRGYLPGQPGRGFPWHMLALTRGAVLIHTNFPEDPFVAKFLTARRFRDLFTHLCQRAKDLYGDLGEYESAREEWLRLRPGRAPVVFARDGYSCLHCGSLEDLTVDHIMPVLHGGSHGLDNLQTLCRSCNSRKGARVG